MAYVCEQLQQNNDGVVTCVLWVEQVTINDMFGITPQQAGVIGLAFCLLIITGAVFNKLSQIGEKSHD
ncbi:hypothetical protein [Acinetobacter ursingii]|uniref:hypothetical protein n=1 Tax=Acinetobacter ursingii TaxID=108980 RepID=UPI00124D5FD1|nr:hypothetical protein [Acinetobacter ursingii]